MHYVGMFLNPCMKSPSFLIPIRKKAVLEKIKQLINEITTQQPQIGVPKIKNDTVGVNDDDQDQDKPTTKKFKIDNFSELCDRDCDDGKRKELAEYINMKVPKNTKMMQFWHNNSEVLPNMFKVA